MKKLNIIAPTSVRFPPELKRAIMRRAEAENRTFSQQVIHVLKQHVADTPEPKRKSRKL
jgi:hypothetical protein